MYVNSYDEGESEEEEIGDDVGIIKRLSTSPKISVTANNMYHSNEIVDDLLNEDINMYMSSDTANSSIKVKNNFL